MNGREVTVYLLQAFAKLLFSWVWEEKAMWDLSFKGKLHVLNPYVEGDATG